MGQYYPPQEVLKVLGKLNPDHYVEVRWIDACEIRDASEKDVERGFETPVKAIGRVYGVKKDYLILVVESSPVLGFRVLSIPIGCIRKIRILTRKPSKKKPLRIEKTSQPYKLVYVYVKTGKIPQLRTKSFLVEEKDWKGLVALTVSLGYVILLVLRVPNTENLGVAVGLIVGWYFSDRRGREKSRLFKLPRASEKHPDFKRIRGMLVEALKKTETYNPAYDDLLVEEIAKTVIDIRRVDREIDKAENLTKLKQAVSVKAVLLEMLEDSVEALAISRRSRLKRGEAKLVKDTMMERLKN